jgi:hypothetical protein
VCFGIVLVSSWFFVLFIRSPTRLSFFFFIFNDGCSGGDRGRERYIYVYIYRIQNSYLEVLRVPVSEFFWGIV